MTPFQGRSVLVTGIGRPGQVGPAVANAFARAGASLILVAHDGTLAEARAREIRDAGGSATAFGCDLTDPTAVEDLARRVGRDADRLDALVNVAGGFGVTGVLSESDPSAFQRQFEINVTTAYLATRAFLPSIRAAKGSVVFFASEAALPGGSIAGLAAYAAAKSAVVALARAVAQDEAPHGVRSNTVAPGAMRTAANLAAMGDARYVELDDVASVVLFLCSDEARAITGQVVHLS